MGRFSTTIQIQNRKQIEPEQFVDILTRRMKRDGFVPVSESESQFSYSFTFSENKKWITLSSPDYPSDSVQKDARGLAKTMKTISIISDITDSDMATLDLFNTTGNKKDTVVLGRPDYGCEETVMGQAKYWKPLLADNVTWEQILEIWGKNVTFVEDLLSETAPLFDMDSRNIRTDYRDWEYDNKNEVTTLYFKNEEPVFITDGSTILAYGTCSLSMISGEKERSVFSFSNIGGISKGLAIIFAGDCIDSGKLKLRNIEIERHKDPMYDFKNRRNASLNECDLEYFTAPFEEYISPDGEKALIVYFHDYEFNNGVNMKHPSMNGSKGHDIQWFHESMAIITADIIAGDTHEFTAYVIPLTNWNDGQISFNPRIYKSRELFDSYLRTAPDRYKEPNYRSEVPPMTTFSEKVFAAVRKIPAGKVVSYSQVAIAAESPRAARAVGNVLHCNISPENAPCHRVVHNDGRLAEAYVFGGAGKQEAMLKSEGVEFSESQVDMKKSRWQFGGRTPPTSPP
jgi:O-6-methylguanine DNA methyltransferase